MEHALSALQAPYPPSANPPISSSDKHVHVRGGAPPVIAAAPSRRPSMRVRPIYVVLCALLLIPTFCVLGIVSYLSLGSPARALRSAVMESAPGRWHKRIVISPGYLTFDLLRFGAGFVRLPPEAKAALQAVDRAEVGVYHLEDPVSRPNYAHALSKADESMRRRGFEPIVGVVEGNQFVAVYAPDSVSLNDMTCNVVVFDGKDLVIVSARGNIAPLLDIARRHLHDNGRFLSKFQNQ
jgi:hypothetical protein